MTDEQRAEALRLAEALDLYATGDKHQRPTEEAAALLRAIAAAPGEPVAQWADRVMGLVDRLLSAHVRDRGAYNTLPRAERDSYRREEPQARKELYAELLAAPPPQTADAPTAPQPASAFREFLGNMVRSEWVAWAKEQPSPKASWLQPWEALTEPAREVDRRIGEAIWRFSYARDAAAPTQGDALDAKDAERYRWLRDYGHAIYNDVFNDVLKFDTVEAGAAKLDAAIDSAIAKGQT